MRAARATLRPRSPPTSSANARAAAFRTPRSVLVDRESGPDGGNVAARLRLGFAVAVPGPILIGRDSHMGGGLFLPEPRNGVGTR